MSGVYGVKRKQFIVEMIIPNIPKKWNKVVYIEPFGGTFAVGNVLIKYFRISSTIYNDIVKYDDIVITADTILNTDYFKVMDAFNMNNDCFFYIDPPYYGKEDWYGMKKFDKNFHIDLFNKVESLKCPFLISYEDCEFIRTLYKDYEIIKYEGTNKIFRHEILITK